MRSPSPNQRGRSESPYSQRNLTSRSASPSFSRQRQPIDLVSSVQRDLEKTKQKMQLIQEKKQKQTKFSLTSSTSSTTSSSSPSKFQPVLLASNKTNQIMSNSSLGNFETRNLLAVETLLLRKVISSRTPSPGPGHYYNNNDINIHLITDSLSYTKALKQAIKEDNNKDDKNEENENENNENENNNEEDNEQDNDESSIQKNQKQIIKETISGIDASLYSLSKLSSPPRRLLSSSSSSSNVVPNPGHSGYSFGKSKHTTTLTSKQLAESHQYTFSKAFES